MPAAGLTEAERARYRRDGFVFPVPALQDSEVATARAWLDDFERRHAGLSAKERRESLLRFKPHLLHPALDAIIRQPRILDAIESLIGPDILVWSSAFFMKDAHDRGFVSWHQDSVTYGLEGDDLVSAWIALTDVDAGNASMRFLPGSHRAGLVHHRLAAHADNMVSLGETIDGVDEARSVGVALRAGEMSLHHIHLMHASDANASDRPRIGYVVRYFPPDMRAHGGAASALLVRGEDRHGNFELEQPPLAAEDPATIARHARAVELRKARVFAPAAD